MILGGILIGVCLIDYSSNSLRVGGKISNSEKFVPVALNLEGRKDAAFERDTLSSVVARNCSDSNARISSSEICAWPSVFSLAESLLARL